MEATEQYIDFPAVPFVWFIFLILKLDLTVFPVFKHERVHMNLVHLFFPLRAFFQLLADHQLFHYHQETD